MEKLVSILIPNFNKEIYLGDLFDSILKQTYTNWECIVVDDHSSDNSWEILESYSQKDSRIKIFKRPETRIKGVSTARNYAIELAEGEYVALLDSDDTWGPNRLELAIEFLTSYNVPAIFSGAFVEKQNSIEKLSARDILSGESIFDFILSDDVFCPTPSFILQKALARSIMFDEDLKRHEDFDFFIRVHEKSPWRYFQNYDVRVNWTRDDLKVVNYKDCIPFYERHWQKSRNVKIRHKYILRITSSSVRGNYKYNLSSYFREVLEKEGYKFSLKEYVLFYTPFLFLLISKLKWLSLSIFSKNGINET
jgi:glycosyltransferase involved in cell wall biosynthesis